MDDDVKLKSEQCYIYVGSITATDTLAKHRHISWSRLQIDIW